ncbi:MAG: hypothetical protein A2W91_02355 [Bacteroidetes bacterium GWF2_38_335]|nr:MAG: hypothetical protein A2W91_02355 [Bacteroidetes bacterium GWF2_38_335]OFY80691.1 MAG: hypothetical protein A2281_05370 [Bacteroidetes bacterium RIFOXYA12_FULL_38_20]HBS87037.1 hypothetical protein [Bacteroidales bacterium]
MLFIIINISFLVAQSTDFQNTQFIRLTLTENKNMMEEYEVNHHILKNTDALFCSVDFGKKIITVVMSKDKSPEDIINQLTSLGFSTTGLILKDYNDEYFLELYKNFRYKSAVDNSDLGKADTRNPEKDQINFLKANEILN